jgi:hypothetical protein
MSHIHNCPWEQISLACWGKEGLHWPLESCEGEHGAAATWAWLACPSVPRQDNRCGHAWEHAACLGSAGSTHRRRGECQVCVPGIP